MALSTEQRAEINRRNASKSTGPRSQEGKDKSRGNAWRHGLTARVVAPVRPEEAAEYAERRRHWHHDMRPQNVLEAAMIDRACRANWKLDLCTALEDPMRAAARAQAPDEEGPDAGSDLDLDLELLMRYEAAAERELHRAVNTFLRLRKDPELVPPPLGPFAPEHFEPMPEPEPEPEPESEPEPGPGPGPELSSGPKVGSSSSPGPRHRHVPARNEASAPAPTGPRQPSEAPRQGSRRPPEGPRHGQVN